MAPIFILSCRRSGTTWIQRLLTSTREVLVWGETNILSLGANMVDTFSRDKDWGNGADLHAFRKVGPDGMFPAHLHPFQRDMDAGWSWMMESVFGMGARREGFPRWGIKDVFWQPPCVEFIRRNWPDYRIIFLTRKFDDTYRSIMGTDWIDTQEARINFIKNEWINTAKMISTFANTDKERHFRYEDLLHDYRPLVTWCGIKNPAMPMQYIGSTRKEPSREAWDVVKPFRQEIDELQKQLGYIEI